MKMMVVEGDQSKVRYCYYSVCRGAVCILKLMLRWDDKVRDKDGKA